MPLVSIPILPARAAPEPRAAEPIPDWWATHFRSRQDKCRQQILRLVGQSSGPLCYSQVANYISHYSRQEHEHAIATLVAAGRLVREVRRERRCAADWSEMIDRVYLSIPGKPTDG